jgi:hypothetical protein
MSNENPFYNEMDSNDTPRLMLFYTDWCFDCRRYKSKWNIMKNKYEKMYDLKLFEYNCTDTDSVETKDLMNWCGINKFPTILLIKDNNIIEFEDERTETNMDNFIQSCGVKNINYPPIMK